MFTSFIERYFKKPLCHNHAATAKKFTRKSDAHKSFVWLIRQIQNKIDLREVL